MGVEFDIEVIIGRSIHIVFGGLHPVINQWSGWHSAWTHQFYSIHASITKQMSVTFSLMHMNLSIPVFGKLYIIIFVTSIKKLLLLSSVLPPVFQRIELLHIRLRWTSSYKGITRNGDLWNSSRQILTGIQMCQWMWW